MMQKGTGVDLSTSIGLLALITTVGCADSMVPGSDTSSNELTTDARPGVDTPAVDRQPDLGGDAATPEIISEGGPWCRHCTNDADCEPDDSCCSLGSESYCFADCETNADCGTGWMCYQLGRGGKQCIPMSFSCEPPCLREGCPEGRTCDQQTGTCEEPIGVCGTCDMDWDCAEGLRCYAHGHYCAQPCPAQACPPHSQCQQVNEVSVEVCVSFSPLCCYGHECGCEEGCPPETPHCFEGECVQCFDDEHCPTDECIVNDCRSESCPEPEAPFELDGDCVGCLGQEHCPHPDYCNTQHNCQESVPPNECAYCQDPYPACTQINGVWSCVQCTDDSYCIGEQTCDTTIFACTGVGGDPIPPCTGCTSDADCVSLSGTFDLACDVPSGCCYDLAGACDGVEAGCLSGECESILEIVGGGIPIPFPEGLLFAHCTCEQPIDTSTLLACLQVGSCPSGDCPTEAVCLDVDDIISWVAQPEGWPPDFPGMCIGVDVLIQSFLPGG